jgi:hypothetical protein
MIVYPGSVEDAHAVIQFLRRQSDNLRPLRKLIVSRDRALVLDVNGNGMEFPGLTYGCSSLYPLVRELGIQFPTETLHNPNSTPDGIREFILSACWTWGYG